MAKFDPTSAVPETGKFDPSSATLAPGQFDPSSAVEAPPEAEPGMLYQTGRAFARGLAGEAASIGKFGGMVVGKLAEAGNYLTGGTPGGAEAIATKYLTDPMANMAKSFAPTEQEAASLPLSIAHGLGSMGADLPIIALSGGLAGAPSAVVNATRLAKMGEAALAGAKIMTPLAAIHGVNTTTDRLEQGVDMATALKSGAMTGVSNVLSGALPVALQGGLLKRMLTGAASGVAGSEIDRTGQNEVLKQYPNLHQELTAQSLATNAAMGAMLGGVMGPRPEKTAIKNAIAETEAAMKPEALQIGNTPDPMIGFPDGTVGRRSEAEAYINSLPEDQRAAARAKMMGLGPQAAPVEPVPEAPPPAQLGYTPGAGTPTRVVYPDGSVAHPGDVEAYLKSLPDDQARMDARARLYGLQTKEAVPPEVATPEVTPVTVAGAPVAEPAPRVPTPTLEGGHVPTALELAMQEAQLRSREVQGRAGTQAGFEARAAADAAAKEADYTAIQNITKGRELAEQAAATPEGTVPGTTTLAARPQDFLVALRQSLEGTQRVPGKLTQEVAEAVKGKTTMEEQIAAIDALRATKKPNTVSSDLLGMMRDKIAPQKETVDVSQTPSEKAPEAVPPAAEQPAIHTTAAREALGAEQAARVAEPAKPAIKGERPAIDVFEDSNLPADYIETPRDRLVAKAQSTVDALNTVKVGYEDRLRAGARLDDAEQAHYDNAVEMRYALNKTLNAAFAPHTDEYIAKLTGIAEKATSPEAFAAAAKDLLFREAPLSDRFSGRLDTVIKESATLAPVYKHLTETGSAPWVRDLASKLAEINTGTRLGDAGTNIAISPKAVGAFDPRSNVAFFRDGAVSEQTVLHEGVHSATHEMLDYASGIMTPRNQAEAAMKKAYDGLEKLRTDALRRASETKQYGLTDVHEFMAELHSNPEFQQFLKTKGMWQRVVDAVRNLLGLKVDATAPLEKAMDLSGTFFGKERYEAFQQDKTDFREMMSSEKGAAEVTDNLLQRVITASDNQDKVSKLDTAMQYIDQKLLGMKTVQYIADRVRAQPQFSALSKALDGYVTAYKVRELAGKYASEPAAKFSDKTERWLRQFSSDDARTMDGRMQEVAVGSSIGGFDPRMNYADNLKVRPDLDASNKAFIDGINAKFAQLPKEAREAIVEGAQISRKNYVLDSSTVVRGLLNAATGNALRLEADLRTMAPDDAARARMEARVLSARKEANLGVIHGPGLDFMAQDLQTAKVPSPPAGLTGAAREAFMNRAGLHLDGASYTLDKRLQEVFKAAETLHEGSPLRHQLKEWRDKYQNQIDNPYYHAGRSGDFFVNVNFKDMNNQTWERMKQALEGSNKILGDYTNQDHAFFRVDTAEQAAALRRKMVEAAGDKLDLTRPHAAGKLVENGQISNNAGVSQALRSVLTSLHDTVAELRMAPEQEAAMREAMTRKFLSMLPESSTRMATIKRMGVPGYDGTFLQSFSKRALGGTRDTANIYSLGEYSNSFKGMKDAVEDLAMGSNIKDQEYAQSVRDEIAKRYTDSMQPLDNKAVNLINSMGHTFYLAASPAFYIRTMAQPWHRGMPYLGSKFGFVAAAKEMGSAFNVARKVMSSTIAKGWKEAGALGVLDEPMNFKDMGLNAREMEFMQTLHDRGVLDLGQARQLQTMAMGGSRKMQDAVRMAAMTAQYAEMTNRLITGLAAFRLAEKRAGTTPKHMADNTNYAVKAIDMVMDNFDPNNTARQIGKHGFAGKVTPLMTAFMNYNLQSMQQISRTVHDGMFNKDMSPEGVMRSKEAKKEFAGLMATTALISGTMGLPFANAFAGVYNMLTQDADEPSDIRMSYRNFLADNLGVKAGEVAAHGLGALVGVDTSSFGMQDLLPGTEFLASRRLIDDALSDTTKGLVGPALNAGLDLAGTITKFKDGQYIKGIEQALPSGLKGYWKAGELATRGYTDARGNPIGLPATPWDIAIQATGLRPAAKAEQAEATGYATADLALVNHRKSVISEDIFKAVRFGDDADMQSAIDKMVAFNIANPMQQIKNVQDAVKQHMMSEALGEASGTGVATTKALYPLVAQKLRFANQAEAEAAR